MVPGGPFLEGQLPPEEPRLLKFGRLQAGTVRNAPGGLRPAGGDPAGLPGPGV